MNRVWKWGDNFGIIKLTQSSQTWIWTELGKKDIHQIRRFSFLFGLFLKLLRTINSYFKVQNLNPFIHTLWRYYAELIKGNFTDLLGKFKQICISFLNILRTIHFYFKIRNHNPFHHTIFFLYILYSPLKWGWGDTKKWRYADFSFLVHRYKSFKIRQHIIYRSCTW